MRKSLDLFIIISTIALLSLCCINVSAVNYFNSTFLGFMPQNKIYNDGLLKINLAEMKPETFRFENKDLNEILVDKYVNSNTWKDFFSKLYSLPNSCMYIVPWYKKALQQIMQNISFERQYWIIDLYKIPNDTTEGYVKNINYEIIRQYGGNRNKTRKINNKYTKKDKNLSYEELYNMSYKA